MNALSARKTDARTLSQSGFTRLMQLSAMFARLSISSAGNRRCHQSVTRNGPLSIYFTAGPINRYATMWRMPGTSSNQDAKMRLKIKSKIDCARGILDVLKVFGSERGSQSLTNADLLWKYSITANTTVTTPTTATGVPHNKPHTLAKVSGSPVSALRAVAATSRA